MFTLTDNEETMTFNEVASENYAAIGEEYASLARALLMTVRKHMPAREENECEKATGDYDDPDSFDCSVIDRLVNQYSREIAKWQKR